MKKIKIRIVEGYDCGCPDMMPQKDQDHGEGKIEKRSNAFADNTRRR
jgi:hypothetical protein